MRVLVLGAVIVAALAAGVWFRPAPAAPALDLPPLSYVTTARQLGVVGYRDPFGAVSPDGTRLAYAEGRFVRVLPIGGGAPVTLAAGEGQVRYLAWKGNEQIVAEDATAAGRWWVYPTGGTTRAPLWAPALTADLRQLAWRADGAAAAALAATSDGPELRRFAADGTETARRRLAGRAAYPAFTAGGDVACIVNARLSMPCGEPALRFEPDLDVHGPIAFAPDGSRAYFASPNDNGFVELWTADLSSRRARRLSSFSRDAYAPSVAADGTVVFKTQTYRTHLADVPFEGGPARQLTTFQSETPSYHPARPLIAFTYGTWRRVIDDAKYPDIAQEIGVIDVSAAVPITQPAEVLEQSDSEDQAMTWSPNGRWIAFHSHKEMSDDVWLRPADGSQPGKRITFLGRGAEVGWPRWSPDGRTVLLNGARKSDGASVLYTIGVNQDTGEVTSDLREVAVEGVTWEMGHAEWLPGSTTIVAVAKEGPGRHVIFTVPAGGGRATVVHRVATEHDFPGLGVSPNGRFVAFAAPAAEGYYQIFLKAVGAATPAVPLTTDPSHKTQPTFAPDGSRVAFTVWSYEAAFWSFRPQ
jgi:Tol biopolymer transport system component